MGEAGARGRVLAASSSGSPSARPSSTRRSPAGPPSARPPSRRPTSAPAPSAPREDRGSHVSVFLRQLPFAAVVLGIVLWVTFTDAPLLSDQLFAAGAVIALGATTAAIVIPWRLLPAWAAWVVPLADMVAVSHIHSGGFRATSVLVLPVLWLATTGGMGGYVVGVVGAAAAAWGRDLLDPGIPGPGEVQRLLILPGVLLAVGTYVFLGERRSAARRQLLARQSALMEETLDDARDQHRVLRGILNTIDVGVVALAGDGTISIINRAHKSHVGDKLNLGDHVTRHGGVGGFAADGVTPLGSGGSPLVRAARGESFERELTWWDEADGSRTAFRVSAAPLLDEEGRWAGAVVAYQDLTAEMEALAQREDFVASVSHELRTPLTSVVGHAELVIDDPALPERLRRHLEIVERNAERLQRLIGDLLTAGQLGAGQLELVLDDVDLADVVADAVESQRPRATSAGITIEADQAGLCTVRGDRRRLTQVADNLLSNAIKYSRGGGAVAITARSDASSVTLSVADAGVGIAEAEQERLFERFYRAPQVRRGSIAGTGLGLHISKAIVDAHGGAISVSSALGQGTTVEVRLPRGGPS